MNDITFYVAAPGPVIAARLAEKADSHLSHQRFSRVYVSVTTQGVKRDFRFAALAHTSVDQAGNFVPLGDPANDLFDEHGQPLPKSVLKSVRGIVVNQGIENPLASLRFQTTPENVKAALDFAFKVQKNPPFYSARSSNCAMFSGQVGEHGGIHLSRLINKDQTKDPLDIVRAFQAASAMMEPVQPGVWVGNVQGLQAELRNSGLIIGSAPQRHNFIPTGSEHHYRR
jgi:hypothetical protein